MGLRINHNTSAINAHRNLQANDQGMARTLERLSSGQKINRAAEGPAALVISEQMRAQIAGLTQAIDNSETGISMIQTTEANLSEVSALLTNIRQLALHAANEGVNDTLMLEADQNEIINSLNTMDRISSQAQFGNRRLLDGSNGAIGNTTGDDLDFVNASLNTKDSAKNGFAVQVTQAASRAHVEGTKVLSQEQIDAGETLSIIENGKKASYTTTELDNIDTALQNLKSEIRKNGLNVILNKNDEGMIEVQHQEFGSEYGFQFYSSSDGILSRDGGEIEVAESGTDIRGSINGESAYGKGQILTGLRGAEHVDGLQVRFTGEIVSPDQLEDVEGDENTMGQTVGRVYVSQNSLHFQVGANRGQTVGISISSTSTDKLSRGMQNESGFTSLRDIDVRSYSGSQDAMLLVDNAIDQIASKRGNLGAFQKNTLESNLNNLRIANENLISSESVIRDTDMAAEMANFTRNQIMTQSATAMLAQANQTPKNVLQLLG
ncbi:MAG: flagellin [Proteobacteria bacterium]|nr:flagellin [Pseudomonadota bacterium]